MTAKLEIHELTPARWRDYEKLFGPKGACAGCWCIFWRTDRGESFDDVKGATAKRRMRKLIAEDRAHGLIAYAGGEPVGWCAFDRRVELLKLNRAPSLACDDADLVWSLPCFFIAKDWRGKGVASALLAEAIRVLKKRGARVLEGYPVKPAKPGAAIPAAFAYTGTVSMFRKAGFTSADAGKDRGKQRMRLSL